MSGKFLVALAIVLVAFPSTLATQYTVGDSKGWTLGVDYTTWASGKTFVAGDTLEFKYTVGSHNVVVLDQTNYNACTQPSGTTPLTTGDDIITLTAGNQWYICSIPGHCSLGMKLAITVSAASGPAGSPPPPSTSSNSSAPPPPATTTTAPPPPATTTAPAPSAAPGIGLSQWHAWFAGALISILIVIMA